MAGVRTRVHGCGFRVVSAQCALWLCVFLLILVILVILVIQVDHVLQVRLKRRLKWLLTGVARLVVGSAGGGDQ